MRSIQKHEIVPDDGPGVQSADTEPAKRAQS
jgi:hypothetical protein